VGRSSTISDVAVRKLSVALDESVARGAAKAAERQGVSLSARLSAAAEGAALLVEEGLGAVRAWEQEHGELTAEELSWADAILGTRPGRVAS
jgi:hypothetical protein